MTISAGRHENNNVLRAHRNGSMKTFLQFFSFFSYNFFYSLNITMCFRWYNVHYILLDIKKACYSHFEQLTNFIENIASLARLFTANSFDYRFSSEPQIETSKKSVGLPRLMHKNYWNQTKPRNTYRSTKMVTTPRMRKSDEKNASVRRFVRRLAIKNGGQRFLAKNFNFKYAKLNQAFVQVNIRLFPHCTWF